MFCVSVMSIEYQTRRRLSTPEHAHARPAAEVGLSADVPRRVAAVIVALLRLLLGRLAVLALGPDVAGDLLGQADGLRRLDHRRIALDDAVAHDVDPRLAVARLPQPGLERLDAG